MTPQVAAFLRNMLANSTLNVGAPDFHEVAALAADALTQLDRILQEGSDD